jgi:hypothetical protein
MALLLFRGSVAPGPPPTGPYNASRVVVGPGSLYAAPLGTAEPTSVTGAWPTGWIPLGYTDQGSTFDLKPKAAGVMVEEEEWAVRQAISGADATVTFALAEQTLQNLLIVLNSGIEGTPSAVAGTSGTDPDGSLWGEPPNLGEEARLMIGWDALPEAATGPPAIATGRIIMRQCLQTGSMKRQHRKGNAKMTYSATFSLERPGGEQPFRFIFPAVLAR